MPGALPIDRRLLALASLAVAAVALAGFAVGIGSPTAPWKPAARIAPESPEGALPAVPYAEMDARRRGPNRHYRTDLGNLVSTAPSVTAAVVQTEADRQAALARRAARRAYAGAPPTIPHPIDANEVASCYECHGEGRVIDRVVAPRISHQRYTNCTQCHAPVEVGAPGEVAGFLVANTFAGSTGPVRGVRAYAGAPPQIPHATHMRENCTSCHGVLGLTGIRSTHPWRANCIQCHAPSAELDQVRFASDSPPGTVP